MRLKSENTIITCPVCRKTERIDKNKKRKFTPEADVPVLKEKQNFFQFGTNVHANGHVYEKTFCEKCGIIFMIKIMAIK